MGEMTDDCWATFARRELLIGGAALMALLIMPRLSHAAPMASAMGAAPSASDVRGLLHRASRTAFADLSKPDGFWVSPVARIGVPVLFAKGGASGRSASREDLQHRLNTIAQRVLPRASATVDLGIARLGVGRPLHPLGSEPTAATTLLRRSMGPRLVNALIPALARALREANDPVVRQAMLRLKGVSLNDVAHALANETDNAIWYALGSGEAAARRAGATT